MPKPVTNTHASILLFLCIPVLLLFRLQLDISPGHMDEYDYLFVGKTLLSGENWPTHTYIFGWDISWLLLAWGDNVFGGVPGARVVAATFGMISIASMYAFVYLLWRNHTIAMLASLLLGFEAAHLFTSALATYDILSFTAFSCGLPFMLLACQSQNRQLLWTALSCTAFSIAVLSKYTSVIYLPFIAVLVFCYTPRYAIIGMILITTTLIAYAALNFEQLTTLYEIQIQRTHGTNATMSDIISRTARQLWLTLLLAGFAIVYCVIKRHKDQLVILTLVVFSLPLLLYHLSSQNVISLQKHLVFTSLFLLPIIAWWLHEFYTQGRQRHFQGAIIMVFIGSFAYVNFDILRTMQQSYPDVRSISSLSEQILPTEKILSEDPYLFRYLLFESVPQDHINETTWLDNNKDGKYEQRDVQQAIWDKKFDYVFLNDQQHQKLNLTLRKMLVLRNYELIFEQRYQLETMSGDVRHGVTNLYRLDNNNDKLTNGPQANRL